MAVIHNLKEYRKKKIAEAIVSNGSRVSVDGGVYNLPLADPSTWTEEETAIYDKLLHGEWPFEPDPIPGGPIPVELHVEEP